MEINSQNATVAFSNIKNLQNVKNLNIETPKNMQSEDTAEFSQTPSQTQKIESPSILRVLFNRYTKEQISQINETGKLPQNVKVVDDPVQKKPKLMFNLMDITLGTHTMPAGYELRQDILGFTHLVREDSKAWYLRKD